MLFEDPDFPASDSALYYKGSSENVGQIVWKRPQELVADPVLLPAEGDLCVQDVVQGRLGDCWFLCACAAIAPHRQLIQKVIPVQQKTWGDQEYNGRFRFAFWKFGKWTEVTVDDRLPCRDGRLVYSRCANRCHFWLPLLEKAYAKLHGCYEAIVAGQVCDALVDLTGGVAVKIPLKIPPSQLADRLLRVHRKGMLLTCSTNHPEVLHTSGISQHSEETCQIHAHNITSVQQRPVTVRGPSQHKDELCQPHAYNITSVQQGTGESEGDVWLSLHNPWGGQTPTYSRMKFADFCQEFHEVTIASPVPDLQLFDLATSCHGNNHETLEIHEESVEGCWELGVSAGGCRNNLETYPTNPQYLLTIQASSDNRASDCDDQECFVLLTLMQQTNRLQPAWKSQEKAVGIHVWQAGDTPTRLTAPDFINDEPVAMTTPPHAHAREVTLTCLLKPGAYIIIPNTFQPDVGKGFLLRVFSSWPFELRERPSMLLGNSHAPGLPRPPGHALTFHGQWEAGVNAGGCRNYKYFYTNPQYFFCVPTGDENVKTVTITLLQEKQPKLPYMCHAAAFHVYKVDKCERITDREFFKKADVGNCVPHQYLTRVSKQLVLPAGCYVVVPSTHQPNCEGKFVLSVAFD
ncbi:calpain-10-like [Branchiostoma floridae]|uniref:Calpain-10-like n=1 Tax=Branchiostoma floridae TaxID=7739 RepID=A0A9J7LYE1_BRAFL|nr:calpain-10-like [Branchiostoma floridae]